MGLRLAGIAVVCLVGLSAGHVAAQPIYSYPPRGPYAEPPPGYYGDDDVVVVDRRGRRVYFGDETYPVRPYPRSYRRVVPGAYPDEDASPPRPFFSGRPISPDERRAIQEERRWNDRRAALPPADEVDIEPQAPRSPLTPPAAAGPGNAVDLPPRLHRQIVAYRTKEPAGSIVIDTRNTYLYYVLGQGRAVRYGIGVGREGFTWSGREKVSRMAEWPDWYPPKDMIDRQPYLPRMMAGGPGNPLGARALYLGSTLYRIHGTSEPGTIGHYVSSGCIRLLNEDVEDLYKRVHVGTRVVVLPGGRPSASASASPHR